MQTRQGKEFIWEILSYAEIYSSMPGKFTAGKRDVGLKVLQLLEDADSKLYPNLLLEMNNYA